jgi:hypothetical protein
MRSDGVRHYDEDEDDGDDDGPDDRSSAGNRFQAGAARADAPTEVVNRRTGRHCCGGEDREGKQADGVESLTRPGRKGERKNRGRQQGERPETGIGYQAESTQAAPPTVVVDRRTGRHCDERDERPTQAAPPTVVVDRRTGRHCDERAERPTQAAPPTVVVDRRTGTRGTRLESVTRRKGSRPTRSQWTQTGQTCL